MILCGPTMSLTDILPYADKYFPQLKCLNASEQSRTIDDLGEYVVQIFYVPANATIRSVVFKIISTTLVGTLSVDVVGVASNGYANTTLYGGCVAGSVVNPTAGYVTVNFASDCSFVRGALVGIRIKITARTSGGCLIAYHTSQQVNNITTLFPYHHTDTSGLTGYCLKLYLLDSAGAVYHLHSIDPWTTMTTIGFASNSTPDELANKITMPFGARVAGLFTIWPNSTLPTATYTHFIKDVNGNNLATSNMDLSDPGSSSHYPAIVYFTTPVTVVKDQIIYAGVTGGGTSNKNWMFVTYDSALSRAAYCGPCLKAVRTDAGDWTEDNTSMMALFLILDQIDYGGSGMLVHPGMSGGMRG